MLVEACLQFALLSHQIMKLEILKVSVDPLDAFGLLVTSALTDILDVFLGSLTCKTMHLYKSHYHQAAPLCKIRAKHGQGNQYVETE